MSAIPPPYVRGASFTNFSTEPAPTVGQELEVEFNAIKQVSDATQARLLEIQRDDGQLRNLSVHPDALNGAVRALLAATGDIEGDWATGLIYEKADVVRGPDGITYLAAVDHVAGAVFATDLAASRWLAIDSAGALDDLLRSDLAAITAGKGSDQIGYLPAAGTGATTVSDFLDSMWATGATSGAALVRFINSAANATARTAQDKLRDVTSRSDYGTLADFWAATPFKPKIDPVTGKFWLNTDTAPLDYSTSRAGFVFQHRDTAVGGVDAQIPGAVFQFTSTGNGVVNAGTELSQSIWFGLQLSQTKTGDGSGHCATAIGELGAYGPGLYSELGAFQGTLTNIGSLKGTMSGCELLLRDSPNAGATSFDTRLDPFVARIGKYNATTRRSHGLLASSEGTLPPDAIIGGTTGGAGWKRGVDLSNVNITTGQTILSPNNTFMAWIMAGTGTAAPVFGVSAANNAFAVMPTNTTSFIVGTSTFATRLEVDNNATNAVTIWIGGALKRVEQGAADSESVGYRNMRVLN